MKEFNISNINICNDCWIWNGYKNKNGYGETVLSGTHYKIHRLIYEIFKGEIINELHHICKNRACCNPEHLKDVTRKYNMIYSIKNNQNKYKTHCKYGHIFDVKNTRIRSDNSRTCRKCEHRRSILLILE